MPFQQPSIDGIGKLFEMNPGAVVAARPFIEGAQQQGNADLQKTQIENLFDQQNNPLRVEQTRAQNANLVAQLPGFQADSENKRLDAEAKGATQQERIEAARKKFITDATEDDIKQLELHARGMAMSRDPSVRAKGELLLGQTKGMVEERLKTRMMADRQIEQIREQGNQVRQTNADLAGYGKFAKKGSGSGMGEADLRAGIMAGKIGYEKAATGFQVLAQEAYRNGDADEGDRLLSMSNQFAQKAVEQRAAGVAQGQAGKPDIGALGGIPVRPQPQPVPFSQPGPQGGPGPMKLSPQGEDWVGRAMKVNPGMSREQIIEQGRKLGKF